ncbi:MAG TPA: ribosome maturation factor RimM [Geminicoccus sp.]|jgi:16S rRNA processing protein RimM|uniref:ribosome maturation factor RimM n=1 Tax=Geminicoccus sp. TaxID=2024832 RepID=UPI002E34E135|nr:ribosome maturation factor RimM [Geminicoccus sp.]HEX2527796.1 ribosome maturation factor RimM [Geminicoccus sp.]
MAEGAAERMVCVAAVATAHGVRGHLKLKTFTEIPENAATYGPVYDGKGNRLFRMDVVSVLDNGLIVKAEGITDRNAAERLRGTALFVPRSVLPATEEDEFYHEDLIGLRAEDTAGQLIGEVVGIQDFGAGDILEVRAPDGTSHDFPFTKAVVPLVDLAGRRVVIDPPVEVE